MVICEKEKGVDIQKTSSVNHEDDVSFAKVLYSVVKLGFPLQIQGLI